MYSGSERYSMANRRHCFSNLKRSFSRTGLVFGGGRMTSPSRSARVEGSQLRKLVPMLGAVAAYEWVFPSALPSARNSSY